MFDLPPRLRATVARDHVFPRSFGGIGCNQTMCQNGQDARLWQNKTNPYQPSHFANGVLCITGSAETEAKARGPSRR
jgi:hypothetical protein